MKLWKVLALIIPAAFFASLPAAANAASSDPSVHKIESFYATLLDGMKRGPQLGMKGRYQLLAPAVDATFDIPVMIRFICGEHWAAMSDSDHKALAEAFRRMTIANYASNFDSFDGQRFDVDANVQTKGTDRFVQSTLVPKADKPVPFIYRMRETGGDWKAIDIYLNGYVSELATRRSDFASTLDSGGAAALVKKLNLLADDALAGNKSKND